MVSDLPQLVSKGDCTENRRRETLSTGGAVLSGTHLRGLHAWVRLEFNRVGTGDADVYRVALIPKNGTNSSETLALQ